MRSKNLVRAAAIAAALMTAGSATALEKLYGGGADLPAPAYVGNSYFPNFRLSTNAGNGPLNGSFPFTTPSIGSIFDDYTNDTANQVSYCLTGSGFARTVLNGAIANQQCRDFSVAPLGFTGVNAAPDFIGNDVPLSSVDYTNLLSGPNGFRFPIVQIPTLAAAVALPHNASVSTVPTVNLTTEQICRIYSGQITNWSSVLQGGVPVGSGPIHIVYHAGNSLTTLAFTRFLTTRCNGLFAVPAGFFNANQNFLAGVSGAPGIYAAAIPAMGDAVAATVNISNNAIGYADFGQVAAQGGDYALVNGFDPAMFGTPGALIIAPASLRRGMVLDGAAINLPPPIPPVATATKNCMLLIDPAVVIAGRYPIATFSYINTYHGGNGTALHIDAIKKLQRAFYNNPRPLLPAGFAYLDGNIVFGNLMRNIIDGVAGEPGCAF